MTAEPSADNATPAERRRHRVREAILDAAEALFTEEGEAGLSMRRIAQRTDYSAAALYQYFDSKEALVHAIREQFFERLLERLRAVRECIRTGPTLCTRSLRAYVETGMEQPGHYRLAFGVQDIAQQEPVQDSHAALAAEQLRGMIADSVRDGWFRELDLALAASAVWAASHGLTMLALNMPDFPRQSPGSNGLQLDEVIEFQAELVMRGMGSAKLLRALNEGQRF
jgi:AcrR family transcriptional regulator